MNPETWDPILLAVSVLGAIGMAFYYVRGVVDQDRWVTRGALVGFLIFGVVIVVTGLGILLR